jgi:hypothetical protein
MFRHDPGRRRETRTGHMTAPVILTEARPGYGKALVLVCYARRKESYVGRRLS